MEGMTKFVMPFMSASLEGRLQSGEEQPSTLILRAQVTVAKAG
jgi:hypothetical protein